MFGRAFGRAKWVTWNTKNERKNSYTEINNDLNTLLYLICPCLTNQPLQLIRWFRLPYTWNKKIGIYQKRDAVSIKSTVFVIQSRNPGCTCIFPLFTLRNYESNEDDAPAVSTRNKTPQYIYFFTRSTSAPAERPLVLIYGGPEASVRDASAHL